jgi:hypothetical protein
MLIMLTDLQTEIIKIMRLVIENYGDCKILRDKSPGGIPRYVVEWNDGSNQIYNAAWYHLKTVKNFVEERLNDTI